MKIAGVKKNDFVKIQGFYKERMRSYTATISVSGHSASKDNLKFVNSDDLVDVFKEFDSKIFIRQLKQLMETRRRVAALYAGEAFELRIESLASSNDLSVWVKMDNYSTVSNRKGEILKALPPSFYGRFLIGDESVRGLVHEFEEIFLGNQAP